MAANTVSNAVATREDDKSPRAMVRKYATSFGNVLPEFIKTDAFVSLANAALQRDPYLRQAAENDPYSLIHALIDCATLGHLPGKGYALTARKVKGQLKVLGIEEYTGKIERMYRAGAVRSVKAAVVREHDGFRWNPNEMERPEHDFDPLAPTAQRGDLRGVYAYAVMDNGAISQVVVMNRDQVMARRAVAATTAIWDAWPEEQWLKTALRQLEKFVPTSSEYLMHRTRAEAERHRLAGELPPPPVDYAAGADGDGAPIEGEIVQDLPAAGDTWPEAATPGGAK